jgi:tRNA(Ile)-lysidine synthase
MIFRYLLHNLIPKFFASFYLLVAARELRYNWFYELLETENLIIFLRHIMPMIIKTFLINLSRNWIRGFDRIPNRTKSSVRFWHLAKKKSKNMPI